VIPGGGEKPAAKTSTLQQRSYKSSSYNSYQSTGNHYHGRNRARRPQ